ncbi:MAG TPA: hypothetical protein DIT04_08840 [Dysgonomonas sp.]|nr:hypothetical protein [Dysgonomonas sp.]
MKIYLLFLLLFITFPYHVIAQVGINTEKPRAALDVNGDVQVRGKVKFGGTDTTDGSYGEAGQLLRSGGTSGNPSWVTVNIPEVPKGGFYMQSSQVLKDTVGLLISHTNQGNGGTPYDENLSLYGETGANARMNFIPIPALNTFIEIPEFATQPSDPPGTIYNRTSFSIQTVVQIGNKNPTNASGDPWVSFAIGIFISEGKGNNNYKLKGVRVGRVAGNSGSFQTFDVSVMVDNLPPGHHDIIVAARRRDSNPKPPYANITNPGAEPRIAFAIGRPAEGWAPPITGANVNKFMTQTSLKIDVYKKDLED